MGRAWVVGHRGVGRAEPENTLRSFERAAALGCDAVELDVHLSADRRLVVIHDETVNRTTNGKGAVKELPLSRLQRLDAGKGERIPTLDEVLDLVAGRMVVHVELKAPGTGAAAARLLSRRKAEDWTEVSSFLHPELVRAKGEDAKLRTGVLYFCVPVDPVGLAAAAGADALHPWHEFATPDLVRRAHRAGLTVLAWTADREEEIRRLVRARVDSICSNRPEVVLRALGRGTWKKSQIANPKSQRGAVAVEE
ncbi:MAG: glycerophosphodiester phosphodiesterase [Planctomycetes bacterium]|nr:glycerophosphodiester phosphodiesterase [Planctomycetota bacterium]